MPPRTPRTQQPDAGPHASAEPPGQGAPEAAATSEAAAAPPADHAAAPPPEQDSHPGGEAPPGSPDQPAAPLPDGEPLSGGGGTTVQAAAGGQVRGGRLADLTPDPAMPEGVPYAIAREPLYIVNPEAAAAPARAFNPGDRVPAELVEQFGWHDLVQIPEWATAPPAPATESSEEQ